MAGNPGFSQAKKAVEGQASPFNVDKKELVGMHF